MDESIDISLIQYKEKDCYISVMPKTNGKHDVYDSCGSEFISISFNGEFIGRNTGVFYAYIENFDEDYWVVVDGVKHAINWENP